MTARRCKKSPAGHMCGIERREGGNREGITGEEMEFGTSLEIVVESDSESQFWHPQARSRYHDFAYFKKDTAR